MQLTGWAGHSFYELFVSLACHTLMDATAVLGGALAFLKSPGGIATLVIVLLLMITCCCWRRLRACFRRSSEPDEPPPPKSRFQRKRSNSFRSLEEKYIRLQSRRLELERENYRLASASSPYSVRDNAVASIKVWHARLTKSS